MTTKCDACAAPTAAEQLRAVLRENALAPEQPVPADCIAVDVRVPGGRIRVAALQRRMPIVTTPDGRCVVMVPDPAAAACDDGCAADLMPFELQIVARNRKDAQGRALPPVCEIPNRRKGSAQDGDGNYYEQRLAADGTPYRYYPFASNGLPYLYEDGNWSNVQPGTGAARQQTGGLPLCDAAPFAAEFDVVAEFSPYCD